MPKPNIFDFNATGSSWDPDVSASIGLTPELSESIRLLNATIENYVGIDHAIVSDPAAVELRSGKDLKAETPLLKINLDAVPPVSGHTVVRIMTIEQEGEILWEQNAVIPPSPPNHTEPQFKKDEALLNIKNKIWTNGNMTGSHFLNFWDVASGSLGKVSSSIFFVGTPKSLGIPDEKPYPMMGIGTNSPSASFHISSSITGSMTDLIRVQNDFGVPIFKVKPDKIIIRNSGSSANEVTMSVDSTNSLLFNDVVGINRRYMFLKSGSKEIKMEVGATTGNLKFKKRDDSTMNIQMGSGHTITTNVTSSAILSGKNHTLSASTDATIVAGSNNTIQGAGDSTIGGGHLNKIMIKPAWQQNSYNYIGGGQNNEITGSGIDRCFIGGGTANQIYSGAVSLTDVSTIGGGYLNKIKASIAASILGGYNNQIKDCGGAMAYSGQFIVGGHSNLVKSVSYGGGIVGGYGNQVSSSAWSIINGGLANKIIGGSKSTILNGEYNTITHDNVTILGSNITSIQDDTTYTENIIARGDIRATGDVIANRYIVSSSVTHLTQSFSSGSTQFGDSVDDTHTFTGHITASGNISASGESHTFGGKLNVSGDLYLSGEIINDITASNSIKIKPSGLALPANYSSITHAGTLTIENNIGDINIATTNFDNAIYIDDTALAVGIGTAGPGNVGAKGLTVEGNISASGDLSVVNISGSGNLVLGGGTFTSASLAAGGSGGGTNTDRFQIHVPIFPRIQVVNTYYVQDYPGNNRFSSNLGTSIGSEVYTVGSKNSNYIAMRNCKLDKFYATALNPTNDDQMIFAIYKGTLSTDDDSNITLTQIGSDIVSGVMGGIEEDKNYIYKLDFTSGNTLSIGDFLVITVRVSSLTSTSYPYVNAFLELEYT